MTTKLATVDPRPENASAAREAPDVHRLFEQHYLSLVRLATQLLDDQSSAEDVVQDVFAAVAKSAKPLDEPLAYLRLAVVNRSRSALRRRRTVRLFRPPREHHAESADTSTLQAAEHERMLRAVRRLPTRQREVIVLRFYEDLSVGETARLLGISPGAVATSVHRGLNALSNLLEDDHA